MKFGGKTYDPQVDEKRLSKQLGCVYALMIDGRWRTIDKISSEIKGLWGVVATPQGVSARLRDLRKPAFGGYLVERRGISDGLFEYRLLKNPNKQVQLDMGFRQDVSQEDQ